MRRGRQGRLQLQGIQDPGKDLFAYLFLVMMVFSFMLLMSMEERYQKQVERKAPETRQSDAGRSSLVELEPTGLGRLRKKGDQLYLVFGDHWYDPQADFGGLETDGRIMNGAEGKTLYLFEEKGNQVYLGEYLVAFEFLSRQGINVAFASLHDDE
jgi:hypothetical protein